MHKPFVALAPPAVATLISLALLPTTPASTGTAHPVTADDVDRSGHISRDDERTDAILTTIEPITVRTVGRDTVIPFATRDADDPNLPAGTTSIVQAGADGLTLTTWTVATDANGDELWRRQAQVVEMVAPVEQIVAHGTRKPEPPAATPKPTGAPARAAKPAAPRPAAAATDPAQARQIGAQQVAARGWGEDQFACLDRLWSAESGWRTTAANRSGAYGIPQALPGKKMASAGPDWQSSAATQIAWGLSYITARYGTPCDAWAHFQAKHSY